MTSESVGHLAVSVREPLEMSVDALVSFHFNDILFSYVFHLIQSSALACR